MSDTTDMIELMLVAPDPDGGDQLVDDGEVATLLMQETIEPEAVFDKYEALPNHENSDNPVIKCVLQFVKDSISLLPTKSSLPSSCRIRR